MVSEILPFKNRGTFWPGPATKLRGFRGRLGTFQNHLVLEQDVTWFKSGTSVPHAGPKISSRVAGIRTLAAANRYLENLTQELASCL